MCDRSYFVPGRVVALAYRPLVGIQSCDGLYSLFDMVYGKDLRPDLPHYVVPVDLSPVADRSVAEPGVEIPVADQYVQSIVDNVNSNKGMAFLEHPRATLELRSQPSFELRSASVAFVSLHRSETRLPLKGG